jgi:hypothetical protein
MTDWSAILAYAFETTDRKRGGSGDAGDGLAKALQHQAHLVIAPVTTRNSAAVTAVTQRADGAVTIVTTPSPDRGDKAGKVLPPIIQPHRQSVTTVTTVTIDSNSLGSCAVDRLRSMTPPESFSAETWRQILTDADLFFQNWAERAELYGWNEKDLLGVHPRAPAARFDPMGLILLIRGGEVIELDRKCARLRTLGHSTLTCCKPRPDDAVPLWSLSMNSKAC